MKYQEIKITKVEELQVGDIFGKGVRYSLGANGSPMLNGFITTKTNLQWMIDAGAPVQRPIQEVSEPIEFTDEQVLCDTFKDFHRSWTLGEGSFEVLAKMVIREGFKREVTQDSVSRVLTPEQIRDGYLAWWQKEGPYDLRFERTPILAFQAGVQFATGCSLSESSEKERMAAEAGPITVAGLISAGTTGEVQDNGEAKTPCPPSNQGELLIGLRGELVRVRDEQGRRCTFYLGTSLPLPEAYHGKLFVLSHDQSYSEGMDKGSPLPTSPRPEEAHQSPQKMSENVINDEGSAEPPVSSQKDPHFYDKTTALLGLIEELESLLYEWESERRDTFEQPMYGGGWNDATYRHVNRLQFIISRFKSNPTSSVDLSESVVGGEVGVVGVQDLSVGVGSRSTTKGEWPAPMPISTAPRDGTWILGLNRNGWAQIYWRTGMDSRAGWWSSEATDYWDFALTPSLWLPLPDALPAPLSSESPAVTTETNSDLKNSLFEVWSMEIWPYDFKDTLPPVVQHAFNAGWDAAETNSEHPDTRKLAVLTRGVQMVLDAMDRDWMLKLRHNNLQSFVLQTRSKIDALLSSIQTSQPSGVTEGDDLSAETGGSK